MTNQWTGWLSSNTSTWLERHVVWCRFKSWFITWNCICKTIDV